MLYSGFNILPRSVFWSAYLNGRSDNTDVIQLRSMQDEPPNPYQAPSISVETEAKLNAVKFHPLRYFASLLLVFFLTAILAPMDTGVWQSRAMIAECFVYALYLIAQMLVFRGRIREQAITHGPTICFFVSVALVVAWTVAMETRVLPYPPYIH